MNRQARWVWLAMSLRIMQPCAKPDDPILMPLPLPIPNSYWVEPGRLLAGEYPGTQSRAESLDRMQRLLRAGVNTFIDLTQEGELPAYAAFLPEDGSIEHQRWAIKDHELPQTPEFMVQILDAIDVALGDGRCVYVHCRAGIGRTGMTIGCHLTRRGFSSLQALEHLQTLWEQCARSRNWPMVPETDEQYAFVRDWREPSRGTLTFAHRCEGALSGLAFAEAWGTLMETGQLAASQLSLTDFDTAQSLPCGPNTAMTLCVAESLLSLGRHDADDQMQRYLQWSRTDPAIASSADFKRALASWQWSRKANAGTHDPKNLDPHSLARCLAAALYLHADPPAAVELAVEVSRTTQQSPVILDLCRLWTAALIDTLRGDAHGQIMEGQVARQVRTRKLRRELDDVLSLRWSELAQRSAGALSACAAALLAVREATSFDTGMSRALSSPSGTVAALYGSMAGARFGADALRPRWLQGFAQRAELQSVAQRFAG